MNNKLEFKLGGEPMIDILGYRKLLLLISSGVRFKYISYDHKKAIKEYHESDSFIKDRTFMKNPHSYDVPEVLKNKYQVIRMGKLRSIDFSPDGLAWRFKIGNKYSKRYYIRDFGVNVIPYIDIDEHPLDFAKFLTLDNSNQTGSLKQHIFVPKIKKDISGDEYYGNISLCGSVQVHDGDKSIDIRQEYSECRDDDYICQNCIKSYEKLKKSYVDFSLLEDDF